MCSVEKIKCNVWRVDILTTTTLPNLSGGRQGRELRQLLDASSNPSFLMAGHSLLCATQFSLHINPLRGLCQRLHLRSLSCPKQRSLVSKLAHAIRASLSFTILTRRLHQLTILPTNSIYHLLRSDYGFEDGCGHWQIAGATPTLARDRASVDTNP